ncbi:uncharacterized protein DUF547 [Limnobacter thiooxidans]|uniref:DUF547 domain-containing protein n=1 Tax=Limnobacter thiooxidans TaxID=131080 RepID=A0AA86J096_9BURK|nr:DUF547 domain-containing protein [Limnobacter sp.]MCZ8014839.1 DUF547 domain-containing protein [Limnobacter sp.]RZS40517.1 uncharacterized protein DUF547 [Limnobacter thiooxidans]BET27049.1 DUF547 domain-containing protein [Limnobacter thiooxidans]
MLKVLVKMTALLLFGWSQAGFAASVDQNYAAWNSLLEKHVKWLPDNKQSVVDYDGFKKDRDALKQVLNEWSALSQTEFNALNKNQQMAFLINAYNGFTVELVLTKYPNLKSIKDIGGVFSSPWKQEFFTLLGKKRNLDWIEHEQLRPNYKEPRVHAAVNCASIGCPALRNEAFTANKLNAQLDDGMRRFLSDPSRNRVKNGELQVSPIFKWFAEDFEKGHQGFKDVKDVFAKWAKDMGTTPEIVDRIASKSLPLAYTDYNWALNEAKR